MTRKNYTEGFKTLNGTCPEHKENNINKNLQNNKNIILICWKNQNVRLKNNDHTCLSSLKM